MCMVMRPAPWLLLLVGCAPASAPRPATNPAGPPKTPAVSVEAAPVAPPAPPAYRDCGGLACKAFPSAEAAFDFVLAENPRVLAVGEAHAQGDGSAGVSATRRFMDGLLPRLAPRASDLVIELWVASGSCGKVEQQVQKQQAEVTAPQAATNQSEFMELGHRAKALRIMPQALVPSCEQYRKIAGAGAGDIAEMLTMLRDVTERDVRELLSKRPPERLIVAYGGALHNDLAPREGREDFSFGPALSEATGQRYVELDLIIPEQIKDHEAWRGLPWYSHYSRENAGEEAYLFSWAPRAYALVFPKASAMSAP
jgi:hypothetical protein